MIGVGKPERKTERGGLSDFYKIQGAMLLAKEMHWPAGGDCVP